MIERYCTKEMKKIWVDKNKVKKYLLIEKLVNNSLLISDCRVKFLETGKLYDSIIDLY